MNVYQLKLLEQQITDKVITLDPIEESTLYIQCDQRRIQSDEYGRDIEAEIERRINEVYEGINVPYEYKVYGWVDMDELDFNKYWENHTERPQYPCKLNVMWYTKEHTYTVKVKVKRPKLKQRRTIWR